MNQQNHIIKIKNLEQVGMVVQDITTNMQNMWNTFGIGPWDVYVYEPGILQDVLYYKKPSKSGMKVARTKVGKCEIELVEPIGQDNIYQDFANKYGDGIQHLGWHVVESEEKFFTTMQTMEKANFPCIWSGRSPRGRFAYFDTTRVLNTLLEAAWIDKNAKGASPTYVYPREIAGGN